MKFSKGFTFTDPVYLSFDGKIHLGSQWVASTRDLTLSAWQESNWINYTVSGYGTEQIFNGSKPVHAWIDGQDCEEGNKWTYASSIATITEATSTVSLYYDVIDTTSREDQGVPSVTYPSVNFYVLDAEGRPVGNCLISMYTRLGDFVGSFVSQEDGYCMPRQIEEGDYSYRAGYKKYRSVSHYVEAQLMKAFQEMNSRATEEKQA